MGGKAMEEVCVFAKRGWLVKNAEEDAVANLDLLTKSFSGLEGGDAAVKKCLKIKEEAAVLDEEYEYEYYYYADYYDEWDYLEEGEVRRKREAGNGDKNRDKKGSGKVNNGKGKKLRNSKSSKKDGKKKKENKGENSSKRENSKKDGKNRKGNKGKNSGNRENS